MFNKLFKNFSKEEVNWILYDIANSAYILAVTVILPIYFLSVAGKQNISNSDATSYWGIATSLSIIIIAIISPILGTIADFDGKKKLLFSFFLFVGVISMFGLMLDLGWFFFLTVIVISRLCYTASNVFYDAMLVDITSDDKVDMVSSYGYAWGYIGSCIPFIVGIILISGPFKLNTVFSVKLYILITGLWWLILTFPLLKTYKQKYFKPHTQGYIKKSCASLFTTLKDIFHNKQLKWFIISYFFYIDGVNTIISMATIYGATLKLDTNGLIIALLITQFVAFPSSIISGKIAKKYGNSKFIKTSLIVYSLICIYGFRLSNIVEFFVLAILVGMFQGGIQALSRSHFSKLIPKDKSSEYFGFFSVFSKFAEILGPLFISLSVFIWGVPNYGMLFLITLFVLGYICYKYSEKFDISNNK